MPFSIASTVFSLEIHTFYSFYQGNTVGPEPEASHDFCIFPFTFKGYPLGAGGGSVTAGAAGQRRLPSTLRTGEDSKGMAPTLFTPAEITDLPTTGTTPPSHLDLDDPPSFWKSISVLFLVCFRRVVDADWNERRFPRNHQREEDMGGGFIFRAWIFPASHAPPIRVPERDLILIPLRCMASSRGVPAGIVFHVSHF